MAQNNLLNPNLTMLELVATKLGDLNNNVVFLGGCATTLFVTDPAVPSTRATDDVDCIVDIISLSDYHKLGKQLNTKGFKQSLKDTVICRWRYDDIILDVMPIDEKILGFSNRWYKPAVKNVVEHQITKNIIIRSVTAPYFLATKFEAFNDRGNNDFLGSHDLEDIITVIDGRVEIVNEIALSESELKRYLIATFSELLENENFLLALPGHLNYGSVVDARTRIVLERIGQITQLK